MLIKVYCIKQRAGEMMVRKLTKNFVGLIITLIVLMGLQSSVWANSKIIFIPHDNRPISFAQTVESAEGLGFEIVVPPEHLLGNRTDSGKVEALWQWLFQEIKTADSVVLSADSLIYGSLVDSRKHELSLETLLERTDKFTKLKQLQPNLRIYVFASIMRSPRSSFGGVEPSYYEQYGPSIFAATALEDKAETVGLTKVEEKELLKFKKNVPEAAFADWLERRSKNFTVNAKLVSLVNNNDFVYLALGRDDNAPFSQTRKESRLLKEQAGATPVSKFQCLAGIDELGMVLLTRAINDLSFNIPLVKIEYANGVGKNTVPTYSDEEIDKSIWQHLLATGALPTKYYDRADFVLMVNTAFDGTTLEANSSSNDVNLKYNTKSFVDAVDKVLNQEREVVIADIAFANGADNALMQELTERKLLPQLLAYGGWNTANNTAGFAIGQGILAKQKNETEKNYLLSVRLLDDWAYQANIRQELNNEIIYKYNGSGVDVENLKPLLIAKGNEKLKLFINKNLKQFKIKEAQISFPWNRMFEAEIDVSL